MTEVNRKWIYPTVAASENKSIDRIGLVGTDKAHQVVGVDGSRKYGLRPSTGFSLCKELEYVAFSAASGDSPAITSASPVIDIFPFQATIRSGEFVYGFVYRVKHTTASPVAYDIFVDFSASVAVSVTSPSSSISPIGSWTTQRIANDTTADDMDVVSIGRQVFVFVQGQPVKSFYIDYSESSGNYTYSFKTVSEAGPGAAPTLASLINHTGGTGIPSLSNGEGQLFREDDAESLGDLPTPHEFKDGKYGFAYYLHDSKSGRRSALSEVRGIESGSLHAGVSHLSKVGIAFDADTSLYDQIYIFRSVRLEDVGGTYTASILHLDNIYDIADLTTKNSEKVAYYTLDDVALALQDIYLDKVTYESTVPRGASALEFDGSMLVADPIDGTDLSSSLDSSIRNIGELRWSSLTERSPELFPINNKFVPDVVQNRIKKLERAGEFAIGFSSDRLYHIRRNGVFLKIEDLHAGFGLAADNGTAGVGPLCYFLSNTGMKAVANNGQLDNVTSLDNLFLDEWYGNMADIRMEFDPYSSCLFILNEAAEEMACLWFNTGRISEFHDIPFSAMGRGTWPRNPASSEPAITDKNTTMVERAFFLQNHPTEKNTTPPTGWKPRVYIYDQDSSKTLDGISTKAVRTLDYGGASTFRVSSYTAGLTTTNLPLPVSLSAPQVKAITGAYIYVVGGPKEFVGQKAKVLKATTTTLTIATTSDGVKGFNASNAASFASELVFAPSPMYVNWVGGALPMTRTVDNQVMTQFDMFGNKQISSIGCHFSDVTGGPAGYKFFQAQVWNASGDSAALEAIPLDFSGQIVGDSVEDGESDTYASFTASNLQTTGRHGIQDSVLSPGIETFITDLDYKLMAVICRGRTTDTDTGERRTS